MIPINQQDYIRYQQALKGNRAKGAELFRSLLENTEIAPVLAKSPAAAGAVFTDCEKAVNRTLPSILGETQYRDEMILAYVNAAIGTEYTSLDEAAEDERFSKAFHGRDLAVLPLETDSYASLLQDPKIAEGYGSDDAKYAIASNAAYISKIGMSARTVTIPETYSWQWAGAYVPNRGWYAFGAYTTGSNAARTARIWRITDTTAVTAYTASSQQEYIAAGYHPKKDRIYAFRTINTTTGTAAGAKVRPPTAQLFLDIFKISATGALTRESTSTIGTNVNVYEMIYDPKREQLVCVGNGDPVFTFAGKSYSHSRTYAVPVIMIGDSDNWTVTLKYSFSRSPYSYIVRRMSYERTTGKILCPMAFNTAFVINPDNTITDVVVNNDTTVQHTFGNVSVPVGRNRWIVNFYTANTSNSLRPHLLELNEDSTLKSFTQLTTYRLDTLCYDPMTRYLGMLSGNYYAYDTKARSLRIYSYSVITGLSSRFIFTAPDTAQTMAITVGSEVNDYETPSTQTKVTIVTPAFWKEAM